MAFRAVDQWFVALDSGGKREKALEAIESVRWIPDWGKNRIKANVEARPDWCISRQRSWGVPIPAFYDEDGNGFLDSEIVRGIADKVEQHGSNIWFTSSAEQLLEGIEIPDSFSGKKLTKGNDTLDVWIDSGTSHFAVLAKDKNLTWPCDLYLEGSDQHRGWFQSSLWTGVIRESGSLQIHPHPRIHRQPRWHQAFQERKCYDLGALHGQVRGRHRPAMDRID